MTSDRRELELFYEAKLQEAKEYCSKEILFTVLSKEDGDAKWIEEANPELKFHEIWKTGHSLGDKWVDLLIAVPITFPDSLPKFYLSKKSYEEFARIGIPHLDNLRFLCTRDSDVVYLDDKQPGRGIQELLEIAKQELSAGIEGKNHQDFNDEFLAYWNDRSARRCLTLFDPSDKVRALKVYKLNPPIRDEKTIISDDEGKVSSWASLASAEYEEIKDIQAMYIPIKSTDKVSPVDFEDHKDVFEAISKLDKQVLKELNSFFNKRSTSYILIAGFKNKGSWGIFGWLQKRWRQNHFKGFRLGKIDFSMLFRRSQKEPIEKIATTRLDRKRLMDRGGGDERLTQKYPSMAIVGCGSLGSHLSMTLARLGITKMLLIDQELLEIENVPRHLCGMNFAIQKAKKAHAVQRVIKNHFPELECETHHGNVIDLLSFNLSILNSYDILIVALGKTAIERRISSLIAKAILTSPALIIWIEPLGVGGQMLYLPTGANVYEALFDENGNYRYAIVDSGQSFTKREAGCQSVFMPYSSVVAEEFTRTATRLVFELCENKKASAVTWVGDIDYFKKVGYKVAEPYCESKYGEIISRTI